MNIEVEVFKSVDVLDLKNWSKHSDIRYMHYDFSSFPNDESLQKWHKFKNKDGKQLYSIKVDGLVRGYISLRDIDKKTLSSTMGIAIDPSFVGIGIGSKALRLFLDSYFFDFGFRLIKLKVSDFNKRAKHTYEKVGFEFVQSRYEKFENQTMNFKLLLECDDFKMVGDFLYTKISSYVLSKASYMDFANRNV